MPSSSLTPALCRVWPNSVVHGSNELDCSWPHSASTAPETYRLKSGASAAPRAHATVAAATGCSAAMQVRPLSVVSGAAGASPFGCSPFDRSGWL